MDLYWVEVCLSFVNVGQTGDIVCQNGVKEGLSGVTVERSGIIVGQIWALFWSNWGHSGYFWGLSELKWHHIRS